MLSFVRYAIAIVFLSGPAITCFSDDARVSWPFRSGPNMDGHVSADDAKGLPTEFSEEGDVNVQWKVPLQGHGYSTPVIGDGRLWFTSASEDGKQQYVECFEAKTGRSLVRKLLFENETPEPLGTDFNTYASPSCALEQDAVYVHFGEYGTARLNPETADVVWQRRDIKCRHYRGPGSSPTIYNNLLILTYDGISAQFLTALDKTTGETVWRTDRTTDYQDLDKDGKPKRFGDLRKAFGTPGLIKIAGRTQCVSIGSRAAFGYDVETGTEIWTCRHEDFNAAAPPAFFQDSVIFNTGDRTANTISVRLDPTTKGDVTDSHMKWNRKKGNSRLASPVLVDDRLYMITDTGVAVCLDADSGAEVWKDRVGGTHVASPIAANGLIYFFSEEGENTIIKASDTFEVVAKNRLATGMRASPSVAHGRLYLRTFEHLYCIGQ